MKKHVETDLLGLPLTITQKDNDGQCGFSFGTITIDSELSEAAKLMAMIDVALMLAAQAVVSNGHLKEVPEVYKKSAAIYLGSLLIDAGFAPEATRQQLLEFLWANEGHYALKN